MKIAAQLVAIALIGAVAVPLSARFVPGTHPWLDRAGLLSPLQALGITPTDAEDGTAGGPGGRPNAEIQVVALPVGRLPREDVVSVIGSGRGVAAVDLSFAVSGQITRILAQPGDQVAAGTLVAELDTAAAQLSVDRARLVLQDAQRRVDRFDQLARSGTATDLQRQEAELALRTAELELKTAERALQDHRLSAPVAGFVGLIEAQVGDNVSSSTIITSVEDRSALLLDFRVPERLAPLIGPGDPVSATAISMTGSRAEGRITAVDNRVDEASRTLRVQARIPNPDDRFRSGMAFRIDLAFQGTDHPAVDPLAIQWGSEGAFVWVVREGKATRQPITIIQRNAETVLVEADFADGDLVVSEGVNLLRPGATVTVAPPRS
jgi:RND family efflux transporter MFP subunit